MLGLRMQLKSILCILSLGVSFAYAGDLVGCGGFIQSDIPIKFNQVEVALYTKDGTEKFRTDCAPNNGYFLVPLYEMGEFVLRVEPPAGWKFNPDSVDLNVDGVTDACSRGEDINFVFAGFALNGQVVSRGESEGPEGVSIEVRKAGSDAIVTTLLSGPGGQYQAPGLLPGSYVLTAAHQLWQMEKASASVELKDKNAVVQEPLVVMGYDVHGSVESDGKPTSGVSFLLYGKPKVPVVCEPVDQPKIDVSDMPGTLLCEAVSGADGLFHFASLPLGEYYLKPYYRSEHITFDVLPKKMAFTVGHDSVQLGEKFRVHGFTVSGRVLSAPSGIGIVGAKITAKGLDKPSVSDANGQYLLEHVRPGVYHVSVSADGYYFKSTDVTVSASAPQLSDLVAFEYALCGKVSIASAPTGHAQLSSRKIKLQRPGQAGGSQTVSCDDKGKFCFRVAPGKWEISSVVSSSDKSSGLLLHPASQVVEIINRPVDNVVFSQFFATLRADVSCMSVPCTGLPIALQSLTNQQAKRVVLNAKQVDEDASLASVSFKDVLPGQYRLSILYDKWCWEKSTTDIVVGSENVEPTSFKQVGHLLKCLSSHALVLHYKLTDDDDDTNGNDTSVPPVVEGNAELTVGSGQVCLPRPGMYELTTKSCHKFSGEPFTYSTSVPGVVSLTAVSHSISGSVVTSENSDNIVVSVVAKSPAGEKQAPIVHGPLKASRAKAEDGTAQFIYHFTHWAKSGDTLTISPKLEDMLFAPQSRSVTVPRESCPERVAAFHGRRGVYVAGKVSPAVAGVTITVMFQSPEVAVVISTDAKGEYRYGPIDSGNTFSVSAFLDGYVIEPEAGSTTNFLVSKLGEINIAISADAVKVAGVLVSLSGGKFRSNNFTGADGRLRFLNLAPGQYFLRCMLKEYSFEPASQLIDVAEGGTVNVDISASRVSFSCFGVTRSLGGVPEAGITVFATGIDKCQTSRESTVSVDDGTFRLRGLNPGCTYRVAVEGSSSGGLRAIPTSRLLTVAKDDVHGINMVVFQPPSEVELSGYIQCNRSEYLSTVKVTLYAEPHLTSSPLQILTLNDHHFFHFAPLQPSNVPVTYRFVVESTLSRSSYTDLSSDVKLTVMPGQLHRHAVVVFNPRPLTLETESSLRHGSVFGLLAVLLLTVCVIYQQRLLAAITTLVHSYFGSSGDSSLSRNTRRR